MGVVHRLGNASGKEISRQSHIPQVTVSSQLARLRQWGFVTATPSETDKRVVYYSIADPTLKQGLDMNYHGHRTQFDFEAMKQSIGHTA